MIIGVSASGEATHEYLMHHMYDIYTHIIPAFKRNSIALIIPNQFTLMTLNSLKYIILHNKGVWCSYEILYCSEITDRRVIEIQFCMNLTITIIILCP